jgi:hypothetical protein
MQQEADMAVQVLRTMAEKFWLGEWPVPECGCWPLYLYANQRHQLSCHRYNVYNSILGHEFRSLTYGCTVLA